ncbi:MAG TPA: DUF192 domain-containing protein [Tepidisphaeraceae bacterium]|nr:DUF192 domain-containing protein [Tepidisphaeraceae bacterium]
MNRDHRDDRLDAMGPRIFIRGFVLALVLLGGCAATQPADGLPTVQMTIGSRTYTLEIANTVATQERGLMRRDSMPSDHGMIFVFATEGPRSFWMHNTRFDLDIIYIAASGKIVSIKHMKAYDETSVPSDGPVKYAIELNAGQAALTGVKPGDVLSIPAAAQQAKE